jgi:hypothetical protein
MGIPDAIQTLSETAFGVQALRGINTWLEVTDQRFEIELQQRNALVELLCHVRAGRGQQVRREIANRER